MNMIQAIVRPGKERDVVAALEKAGFYPYTRNDVSGRGRQRGIQIGTVRYDVLAKVWLMLVVEEGQVERVVDTIKVAARTGNPGDGKVFVHALSEARTISARGAEEPK